MKRVVAAFILAVGIALSFSGCANTAKPKTELSLVLRNATGREFVFNVPAKSLKSDQWWVVVESP